MRAVNSSTRNSAETPPYGTLQAHHIIADALANAWGRTGEDAAFVDNLLRVYEMERTSLNLPGVSRRKLLSVVRKWAARQGRLDMYERDMFANHLADEVLSRK